MLDLDFWQNFVSCLMEVDQGLNFASGQQCRHIFDWGQLNHSVNEGASSAADSGSNILTKLSNNILIVDIANWLLLSCLNSTRVTIQQIMLPEFCQSCIAISIVATMRWSQMAS